LEAVAIWATLAALTVTVGLHVWRRNAVLSILGGTLVNVLIVSLS
jgi:branched-subunit amino acid transport protein AzlD